MRGLKPDKEILDKIIENYLIGKSYFDSTKEFNLSSSVCQNELKRRGIKSRLNGTWQSPSIDKKDLMITNYLNGMNSHDAGKSIGVSFTTCLKELKRRGITARESNDLSRISFNYNYFETIDSEEKAYWLGFILADGYITGDTSIGIQLKGSDKSHLDKFSKSIEFNGNVKEFIHNKKLSCSIRFSCKKTYNDLIKHGITPRKSLTIVPNEFTDYNLSRAYWRGIVDGDGWFTKYKSLCSASRFIYDIGLCGNKFVIDGFVSFLHKNGININTKIIKRGNIYYIKSRKKEIVKEISDLLYKDSTIYLDRKYEKYLEFNR
jgi:hypothetical protein